jgi:hypothetical protein
MTYAQADTPEARVRALYSDLGCYIGSAYEQRIVAWMTKRDHPGYAQEIADASDTYTLTVAEAGRDWQHCEFTRQRLVSINAGIRQAFEDAVERYTDWATD